MYVCNENRQSVLLGRKKERNENDNVHFCGCEVSVSTNYDVAYWG